MSDFLLYAGRPSRRHSSGTMTKKITLIMAMALSSLHAKEGSLKQILRLSEDIGGLEIVDRPRKLWENSPAKEFSGLRIESVKVFTNGPGARSIISPIAQSFIDLVRYDGKLEAVKETENMEIVGLIELSSTKSVFVRRSETQIILEHERMWGAISVEKFPNLLGISAKIVDPG